MINLASTDKEKDTRPWVIAFRHEWHTRTPEIAKVAMAHQPNFQFWVAENWADLTIALTLKPSLILFHQEMAKENNITITEFIAMLRTMIKMVPGCNPSIGISIEKSCTSDMIKEFKNLDVSGIVPHIASYGVDRGIESVNTMMQGKQYWPKDIIDELLQIKRPTKSINHDIHLTVRQKQVMDLVCHRGLPNKTIANMLHITESTVKIHVSAILKEYGVRNRTQLALASRDALHD
jgi:two-component system nitrate/nitrite response regulator NarL